MGRNGMVPRSDSCVRLGLGTEPTDPSKRNIRPRCRPEASGQIGRIARNAAERLANRTGQELISTRLSLLTVTVAVALLCRPPPGPSTPRPRRPVPRPGRRHPAPDHRRSRPPSPCARRPWPPPIWAAAALLRRAPPCPGPPPFHGPEARRPAARRPALPRRCRRSAGAGPSRSGGRRAGQRHPLHFN